VDTRSWKRGPQTITAINPKARLESGLPILNAEAEMKHSDVKDPYNKNNQYYSHQYLCLLGAREEEIIGHWEWARLGPIDNWYEDVVLPAFRSYARGAPTAIRTPLTNTAQAAEDLADVLNALSCKCTPDLTELTSHEVNSNPRSVSRYECDAYGREKLLCLERHCTVISSLRLWVKLLVYFGAIYAHSVVF
jgi:hypothetical protein